MLHKSLSQSWLHIAKEFEGNHSLLKRIVASPQAKNKDKYDHKAAR